MRRHQEIMDLLGLPPLQARVYTALATGGPASAGRLASVTGAPRSQLYEVLAALQERDIVEVHLTAPRVYGARPVADVIRREADALRRRADELERRAEEFHALFSADSTEAQDPAGPAKLLQGRRAVAREIDELLGNAQRDVVIVSTVGAIPRIAKHLLQKPSDARRDLVVPETAPASALLEQLAQAGVDVHRAPIPFRSITLLVDGRELLRVHPRPDDARRLDGQDVGMRSLNPAFIHDQAALIYAILERRSPRGTARSTPDATS